MRQCAVVCEEIETRRGMTFGFMFSIFHVNAISEMFHFVLSWMRLESPKLWSAE